MTPMNETVSAGSPKVPDGWQRAMLGFLLLAELEDGSTHGYALAKKLEARSLNPVKGATLYPVLGKLEAENLVSTQWAEGQGGPGRKVYSLTPQGKAALGKYRRAFENLAQIVRGSKDSE